MAIAAIAIIGGLSSEPSSAAADEPRTAAVVLATFADAPPVSQTAEQIRERVFTGSLSMNAYYRELSYGEISFAGELRPDGDVFGWYEVNVASAPKCDVRDAARTAAQSVAKDGGSLAGYDHLIFVLNLSPSCPGGGLADSSEGAKFFVSNEFSIQDTPTYIHEMGHSLDIWHAGAVACRDTNGVRVTLSGNCSIASYGDCFDPMGTGRYQPFANWRREHLGILSPESIKAVVKPGTYALHAALYPTDDVSSLRIPRTRDLFGNITEWYDLELRQPGSIFDKSTVGCATNETLQNSFTGVTIRIIPVGDRVRVTPNVMSQEGASVLLDTTPETEHVMDAPLRVGREVLLPTDGAETVGMVKIKTQSAANGIAQVAVDFPKYPHRPSNLVARLSRDDVLLKWDASGAPFRYVVMRDGQVLGYSARPEFLDTGNLTIGSRDYVVYAEDERGWRSDTSNAVRFDFPDVIPPTRPNNFRWKSSAAGTRLQWDASTDNVAVVKYVVFRDGDLMASVAGGTTEFVDGNIVPGQYSYAVYSEDAAGNQSANPAVTSVLIKDERPPTKPEGLVASVENGLVHLAWSPSKDETEFGHYVVYRNSFKLGTTAEASFANRPTQAGLARYEVFAVDAAGNKSQFSAPIAVEVGFLSGEGEAVSPSPDGALERSRRRTTIDELPPRLALEIRRRGGRLVISAKAKDASGVDRIELWIDGRRLRSRPVSELVVRLRSPRGPRHWVLARAIDGHGNVARRSKRI